jgi:hypothetical protein
MARSRLFLVSGATFSMIALWSLPAVSASRFDGPWTLTAVTTKGPLRGHPDDDGGRTGSRPRHRRIVRIHPDFVGRSHLGLGRRVDQGAVRTARRLRHGSLHARRRPGDMARQGTVRTVLWDLDGVAELSPADPLRIERTE